MPLQFNLCEKPLFNIIRLKISRILQEKAKLSTKTREKKFYTSLISMLNGEMLMNVSGALFKNFKG